MDRLGGAGSYVLQSLLGMKDPLLVLAIDAALGATEGSLALCYLLDLCGYWGIVGSVC